MQNEPCLTLVEYQKYLTRHRASTYKHVLANISCSRYVAIATQPVHRLQIRPTVHNVKRTYKHLNAKLINCTLDCQPFNFTLSAINAAKLNAKVASPEIKRCCAPRIAERLLYFLIRSSELIWRPSWAYRADCYTLYKSSTSCT